MSEPITISQEQSLFNEWMSLRSLSFKTKKDYTYYFKRFGGMSNFTQLFLEDFIVDLKFGEPVRAFLKSYKEFLIKLRPENDEYFKITIPTIKGRRAKKIPDFLTFDEIERLEQAMPDEEEKLMVLILAYGGLRIQGLMNLTLNQFNWEEWKKDVTQTGSIKVTEKGDRDRIVFIPTEVMERLRVWVLSTRNITPDDKIWTMSYDVWRKRISKYGMIALNKRIYSHILRHSCATWLLNKGWTLQEIKEYLGHESISTTEIYAHLDKRKIKEKYSQLFSTKPSNNPSISSSESPPVD